MSTSESKLGARLAELRIGLRRLLRAPGFSLSAIGMLALGIGLSVAMYSALNGVLLNSLPLRDSQAVVVLQAQNLSQGIEQAQFTTHEAESLAAATPGFAALAYYWWYSVGVFDGERARDVTAHMVGPGYFAALGVEPVIGRLLSDEDIRQDRPYALLSFGEWQRQFGGSAAVIGQRLELIDEAPVEVIGVLPPEIEVFSGETELWRPLPARMLPTDALQRSMRGLMLIGRLQPGTSIAQANAALDARFRALAEQQTAAEAGWSAQALTLLDVLVGDTRSALWGAFLLALLVLLIAAANLALMLDARQLARRRELAVMQALGASPARLRRELLIELATVSALAVLAGSAIAWAAVELLRELARDSLARVDGIQLDGASLGFAVLLGLAVPVLAGLVGSLKPGASSADAIRAGGRGMLGAGGRRRWLPALALALSTVSLVAAFNLVGGLWRLNQVEPGYASANVHAMQFFRTGNEAFVPFTERLMESLAAIPGVDQVALTSAAPLSSIGSASVDIGLPGATAPNPLQAGLRRVSPGYRALLDIPLLGGRDFNAGDRHRSQPVALLSQSAARRLFGDIDPIGRQLSLPIQGDSPIVHEVVGVIADIRNDGLRLPPAPEVLVPFAQSPRVGMTFLARSRSALPELGAQMQAQLHALDPRQPVTRQFVLDAAIADELKPARFFALTVGAFAAVALVLAVLGVYAVASLQQRRRVAEFGLRLAVGARPAQLAASALRDSAIGSVVGVAVGGALVFALLKLADLRALGIEGEVAPQVLIGGIAAMVLAALLAAAVPALRAARTAPLQALRNDQ
jgi:putative ABC transport system permease protein